jgi:hypothetical protein
MLGDFDVVKRVDAGPILPMGGPGFLLAYRPEANGSITVDLTDRPWPDHMGDPQNDPEIYASWATGNFGPGTWPGALKRACQHSWGWPEGRTIPQTHTAFLRIRSSYFLNTDADAPIIPEDYDALGELNFITNVVAALLKLPEALCYFNPNGECVKDPQRFWKLLDEHANAGRMPLDIWSNVRFFRLDSVSPAWSLMDTVGMSQLDTSDHEACFQLDAYDPGEVDNFLRNLSAFMVENGPVIESGDTIDGPGLAVWRGYVLERSDIQPPRDVIRWFPLDDRKAPDVLLASLKDGA